MRLSVVIVNYNVRAYLEQCLRTVYKALEGIDGEVFVVDNRSTDGSLEMVRERFPSVVLIANKDNVGFSRANNQAIREANGEFVLLLNPDTVVGEDVFRKVLCFLDAHPKCGGLGVKMIDGTGRFLPESKRGLPTPQVAFFKIIGLTRLFPKSELFGRYHLGHLPENESAPIEILSGACMFLRKKTLDEVGLLDENFFMYGEDIDLSYRITLGGYENWYFPDARIIHYKGESTKKSSVNYVFVFYNAMAIFAKKHFTQRSAGIFPLLINGSIYLSAAGAIAVRFLNRALLPILDALAILSVLTILPFAPERWTLLPELGFNAIIAACTVTWTALLGGYDRPVRPLRPLLAMGSLLLIGSAITEVLGMVTGTIHEIILNCAAATLLMLVARAILHVLRVSGYGMRRRERERVVAVGSMPEGTKALALLWQTHYGLGWSTVLSPEQVRMDRTLLKHTIRTHRIGEAVFCAKDMDWQEMIQQMELLREQRIELKIAQPEVGSIIGPSSIESLQDLYLLDGLTLASPAARRFKRTVDILVSILVLPLLPFMSLFPNTGLRVWTSRVLDVLLGRKSWVGYHAVQDPPTKLPPLMPGVFAMSIDPTSPPLDELARHRSNAVYAKDYSPLVDLRIILHGIRPA